MTWVAVSFNDLKEKSYFEEIEKWFQDAKFKEIMSYEHPEAGITCTGKYEKEEDFTFHK